MKFHINNEGNPGRCSAQADNCPFGGESEHFGSAEDARKAYEKFMSGATWLPPQLHEYNEAHTARLAAEDKYTADVEALSKDKEASPRTHSKLANEGYALADLFEREAQKHEALYPDSDGVEPALLRWEASKATLSAALQHINGVSKELRAAKLESNRQSIEHRWNLLQEEFYELEQRVGDASHTYWTTRWRAEDKQR